jgi:hypothetical protein
MTFPTHVVDEFTAIAMADYDARIEQETDPLMRALLLRDRGKMEASARQRIAVSLAECIEKHQQCDPEACRPEDEDALH